MKSVIINADDFGLAPSVNNAVCDLFQKKLISSASALACGQQIQEGIEQLDEQYRHAIGLHICLDEEHSVADPDKIRSLINPKTGRLKSRNEFIRDWMLKKISSTDLHTEIGAQFERLINLGIRPSHVDSHGHVHAIPQVANIVQHFLDKYELTRIRKPFETSLFSQIRIHNYKRIPVSSMISFMTANTFRKFFQKTHSACFLGLLYSGHLDENAVQQWVQIMKTSKNRLFEIMCHPGFENQDGPNRYAHWEYDWQAEYHSLSFLKEQLSQNNIELTSYRSINNRITM